MVNEGQVVDELIVAAPGNLAMPAPKALTDDVIAISYVAEVPRPAVQNYSFDGAERRLRAACCRSDFKLRHYRWPQQPQFTCINASRQDPPHNAPPLPSGGGLGRGYPRAPSHQRPRSNCLSGRLGANVSLVF